MFPHNPISTINDLYPLIRDLESTSANPHFRWINANFNVNDTSAKFVNPKPWYCSGIKHHGSLMWQLTFRLGRHLKYTHWNCAKSFWGGLVGAGDWSFSMPNRAIGGMISSDLPSCNPSLPFHLHVRCHPTRGSYELQASRMFLHSLMSEFALMFHQAVGLSNETGQ